MTKLPRDRHAIYGRTFGRSWNPADFDPISVYRSPNVITRVRVWLGTKLSPNPRRPA